MNQIVDNIFLIINLFKYRHFNNINIRNEVFIIAFLFVFRHQRFQDSAV